MTLATCTVPCTVYSCAGRGRRGLLPGWQIERTARRSAAGYKRAAQAAALRAAAYYLSMSGIHGLATAGHSSAHAVTAMLPKPPPVLQLLIYAAIAAIFFYAAKTVYEAPKSTPPQWKKYEVRG